VKNPLLQELEDALRAADAAGNVNDAKQLADAIVKLESDDGPSASRIVGGIGTEVASGIAGQAAGAALIPFTGGASYPILAFGGGVAGSIAAQKVEGRESTSWGRALFAGIINLIPGGGAAKGTAKAAGQVATSASRYIGREALKGAALGAGEAISTAAVDEQRVPTPGELAGYGASGLLFGGALGAAIKGGPTVARKLFGKTAPEIDAMVVSGEIRPIDLTPAASPELANVPSSANATRRELENAALSDEAQSAAKPIIEVATAPKSELLLKAKDFVAKLGATGIAPTWAVGRDVSDRAIQMRNEVAALEEIGSKLGRKVDDAINSSPNPASAKAEVEGFMNNKDHGPLPGKLAELHTVLSLARERIDGLQTKLIDQINLGISHGDDKLTALIEASRDNGDYLTRTYRFFTDVNYKPTQKSRDLAESTLQSGYVKSGMSLDEAKGKAREVLEELDAKKLSDLRNKNIYPSAIDGFIKEKKDISPELRAYLGEFTEPGKKIESTLSRVGRAVERDAADFGIKNMLKSKGLAVAEQKVGMVALNLRRNSMQGEKLFVSPEVQRSLNILYMDGGDVASSNTAKAFIQDAWQSSVSVSKAVKVLLNPPSYAVQVYGNAATLIQLGINPFRGAGHGLRLTLGDYGPFEKLMAKSPEARRKLIEDVNEWTRFGIKGSNILDSDIRAGLDKGPIGAFVGKALKPFGSAYTVPDTLGRFIGWKAIQNSSKSIFPEAGDETIKRWAASEIGNVYQNYNNLSSFLRNLSLIGALKQFASFSMELVRNQYHQARIIKEMLAGSYGAKAISQLGKPNVKAMKAEGIKRLSATAVVYGGTYAAIKLWNNAHGVDEETSRALSDSVIREWDSKMGMVMSLSEDGKTLKYANPSYIIPQATGLSVFEAVFSGAPLDDVANIVTNEIFGEGTFVGRAAYGALANTHPDSRRKLSLETDKFKKYLEQARWFVTEVLEPGILRETNKLGMALRGQGELTVPDVAARQIGARINSVNVQDSVMFRIRDSVHNARDSKAAYERMRLKNIVSPQAIEALYLRTNRVRAEALRDVHKHLSNMKVLKFSEGDMIQTMKDAGMNTMDVLNSLDGRIDPFPRTPRITATDVWDEEVSKLPRAKQNERIRQISKSDMFMARSLIAKQRGEAKGIARGITPREALVMNLGVADGTRAAYIVRQMEENEYPQSVLESFKKKGMVTSDVMRDIKALIGN